MVDMGFVIPSGRGQATADSKSAQMYFETVVRVGTVEHLAQHWTRQAFTPDSLSYQGPPYAFIVDEVMLDREVIAQRIPAEHLSKLVSLIHIVEWATRLSLKVRTLGSTPQQFRLTLAGRYIE